MLSKLLWFVPDFILDPIYDRALTEFVRGGSIVFKDDLNESRREKLTCTNVAIVCPKYVVHNLEQTSKGSANK